MGYVTPEFVGAVAAVIKRGLRAEALEKWQESGPVCPACGRKTRLYSEDQFGTIHVICSEHGHFTMQRELV